MTINASLFRSLLPAALLRRAAAIAAAMFTLVGPAVAEPAGMSVAAVAEAMRAAGFEVEVDTNADGAGVIFSDAMGVAFDVFGYSCAEGACTEYLFTSYFDVDGAVDLETINAYNEAAIAGRAYVNDDGDAAIEHLFVTLSDDAALVARNLLIWEEVVVSFAEHIGFFDAAS